MQLVGRVLFILPSHSRRHLPLNSRHYRLCSCLETSVMYTSRTQQRKQQVLFRLHHSSNNKKKDAKPRKAGYFRPKRFYTSYTIYSTLLWRFHSLLHTREAFALSLVLSYLFISFNSLIEFCSFVTPPATSPI